MRLKEETPIEAFAKVSVAGKERLAKLMAVENITIVHSNKYQTAAFDVRTRTLFLPVWENMSKDLYDLFCGHEVSHALYTPDGDFFTELTKGQLAYLNVVEDARIEAGIKSKFPGLRRPMRDGYADLLGRDFFGTDLDQVASFSLIDRINLKAKLGTAIDIPFTAEEQVIFDRVMSLRVSNDVDRNAQYFDESRALAMELWLAAKEDEKDPETDTHENGDSCDDGDPSDSGEEGEDGEKSSDDPSDETNEDSGDSDETNEDSSDDKSSTTGSGDEEGESESDSKSAGDPDDDDGSEGSEGSGSDSSDEDGSEGSEGSDPSDEDGSESSSTASASYVEESSSDPTSATYDAFRENEATMSQANPYDDSSGDIKMVEVPSANDIDPSAHIIPTNILADEVLGFYYGNLGAYHAQDGDGVERDNRKKIVADEVRILDEMTKKGVGVLVKEFEMKKAADASKRARTADTGAIDTNKLHSYKWNENIFKKNTIIPDGKSHGLVMFVDWSGSMYNNLAGTIEQVWSLITFCERVQIPYDVYAFHYIAPNRLDLGNFRSFVEDRPKGGRSKRMGGWAETFGIDVDLMKLASSRNNKIDRLKGRELLAFVHADYTTAGALTGQFGSRSGPAWFQLGMTPLNETIIVASRIVRDFQRSSGVQLVNTVFLTDGAGTDALNTTARYSDQIVIRDPDTRREYSMKPNLRQNVAQTAVLNNVLRDRTGCKVVNFFVASSMSRKVFGSLLKMLSESVYDRTLGSYVTGIQITSENKPLFAAYTKEGGIVIKDSLLGYDHQYFLLVQPKDSADDGIDVSPGAKGAAIKRAFIKSRKTGLKARKVLAEFTELIAA